MVKNILEIKDMEFYDDTLRMCGTFLLKEDDETLGYYIFEEFYPNANTYLYENNLIVFYNNGWINENEKNMSLEVREKMLKLIDGPEGNVESVRNSSNWRNLLSLVDEIKKIRNVPDEID